MSTTVPPRDGDAFNDPPAHPAAHPLLTDETVLRRVFQERYPALAIEAKSQLGEATALTPRVVEGAFVRAWDARDRLETEAQLQAFLVEDVKHGAARALSRRAAAHRFGAHGTTDSGAAAGGGGGAHAPSGDQIDESRSWSHIASAIHGDAHSSTALAQAAEISRHDAAGHMAAVGKGESWRIPVAIGVVALALSVGGVVWLDKMGEDSAVANAVSSPNARTVAAAIGQMAVVPLNDGSRVRLAPESKLSIPQDFGAKMRAVKLDGAATFEVAPGLPRDLEVRVRNAIVDAKGTKFTAAGYPTDSAAVVRVDEGSVLVRVGKESRSLTAGQSLIVGGDGIPRTPTADEVDEALGWTDGRFTVAHRQLREVLPRLNRWYGLDVKVPDLPLLDRPVTIRASLDSNRAAIREVEKSAGVRFGYEGETKVFRDAKGKGSGKGKR